MNDATTELEASAPETTPVAATEPVKSEPKPKKAKKPAAKKQVKAAAKPKAAKTEAKPKDKAKAASKPKDDARKVEGLRRFQVRALKALSESIDPLTVSGIAKRAKISHTMVVMGLGTIDAKLLKAHDKKMGFPSLITLGHVKVVEIDGITAIQIMASGKKALTASLASIGGKLPKVKAAPAA